MSFPDFNNDNRIDTGEGFIGYQICKDVTGEEGRNPKPRKSAPFQLNGWMIVMLLLLGYQVLQLILALAR